jgi:YgiT-type zinc finger domain-containing protein
MSTVECSIDGCLGCYEERQILHVERRDGEPIVIDHVPALVCSICGDVLLTPATVRHLER